MLYFGHSTVIMQQLFVYFLILLWIALPSGDTHLTYIAIRLPLKGNDTPPGSPWPHPKEWKPTEHVTTIDIQKLQFKFNIPSCDIIKEAIKRYRKILKQYCSHDCHGHLQTITMTIKANQCESYPTEGMDESYELDVTKNAATITSQSAWGALRGLETLSQLIYVDPSSSKIKINETKIIDEPRFGYRGIMIDTARHFIPISILKKNMDAMAYNKLNIFHWHIVDDQSFPYQSRTYPELSAMGAYSPAHVYSPDDVKDIIEYARLRGIRVIPEFDTPGHTESWGLSHPELLTPCWVNGKPGASLPGSHGAYEIFNPMLNTTFTFLRKFLSEIKSVFPDKYIHLGMDEVYLSCWNSNPNITDFLKKMNISNTRKLEEYYMNKVLDIAKGINYSYSIWQDPIEHGVKAKADTTVEVWKGSHEGIPWSEYVANITRLGYKTILSSCWYLNYISYGQDWRKYYECDPLQFEGNEIQYSRVLGGEACMWMEYVDGTNLLSRMWPRASAMAERLWSPRSVNKTENAKYRLDQQRCRMLRRGIPAEPILDGYCGDYEEGMTNNKAVSNSASLLTSNDFLFMIIVILFEIL